MLGLLTSTRVFYTLLLVGAVRTTCAFSLSSSVFCKGEDDDESDGQLNSLLETTALSVLASFSDVFKGEGESVALQVEELPPLLLSLFITSLKLWWKRKR